MIKPACADLRARATTAFVRRVDLRGIDLTQADADVVMQVRSYPGQPGEPKIDFRRSGGDTEIIVTALRLEGGVPISTILVRAVGQVMRNLPVAGVPATEMAFAYDLAVRAGATTAGVMQVILEGRFVVDRGVTVADLEDDDPITPGAVELVVDVRDDVAAVTVFGADLIAPYVNAAQDGATRAEAAAAAIGAGASQPEPGLLACSSYYVMEGRPLRLYRGGLSDFRDASIYDFAAQSDEAAIWSDGRQLVIDPAIGSGPGYLLAQVRGQDTIDAWRRATTFAVAPATGSGTLRHLAIGDSLTWRGWVTKLKELMLATGVTYEPVGTFADIAGTPSEGRSSWSPQTYTNLRPGVNLDGMPVIQPVTDVAAYLALSPTPYATGGRWDFNPFIRPAIGGDPVGRVRNGRVFDVRFYLDRFDLPDPNLVTIALVTNPTLQQRDIAETMAETRLIVDAVREALPDAGIALCPNSLARADQAALIGALIRAVLTEYSDREDEGLFVLPWWQSSHPHLGYETTNAAADAIGVAKATVGPDIVHPIDRGVVHRQWAEMVQAWAMSQLP